MDKESVISDMQVRFAPEDREQYGDGWYTFSELAVVSMRAHELIALESTFGVPMASILDNFRRDATFANLACAWLAAGRPGEWKDFNPLIMQAEWRAKPDEPDGELDPGKSSAPASGPGESTTVQLGTEPFSTTPALEPTS